jgi:hypothetical protein
VAVLWRDNQADNRDKGSGTWLVTGDQADDHQLDAAAWLGEATLVLDGIFGGLRDVALGQKQTLRQSTACPLYPRKRTLG